MKSHSVAILAIFFAFPVGASLEDTVRLDRCPFESLAYLAEGAAFPASQVDQLLPGSQVTLTSVRGTERRGEVIRIYQASDPKNSGGSRKAIRILLQEGENVRETDYYVDALREGRVVHSPIGQTQTMTVLGKKAVHHGDPQQHGALMKKHGLKFEHSYVHRDAGGGELATYTFTGAAQLEDGRVGLFALVEVPGQSPVVRMFWRSNSHGVFRVMPAIRAFTRRARYDKGDGEVGISVPTGVGEFIDTQVLKTPPLPLSEAESAALTSSAVHNNWSEAQRDGWAKGSPDYIGKKVERVNLWEPNVYGAREPGPDQQVDYSKTIRHYAREDALLGPVEVFVFRSKDGSLEYTFHRTRPKEGQPIMARIADVQVADAPVNDWGVAVRAPDTQELTANVWEHRMDFMTFNDQGEMVPAPDGRTLHPVHEGYKLYWDEVARIPEIRRAFAHWDLPLPDSPSPSEPK